MASYREASEAIASVAVLAKRTQYYFIAERDAPGQIIARLMGAVPAGSFLVISHPTADFNPRQAGLSSEYDALAPGPVVFRTEEQVLRLFIGLDLIEPGLVPTSQ